MMHKVVALRLEQQFNTAVAMHSKSPFVSDSFSKLKERVFEFLDKAVAEVQSVSGSFGFGFVSLEKDGSTKLVERGNTVTVPSYVFKQFWNVHPLAAYLSSLDPRVIVRLYIQRCGETIIHRGVSVAMLRAVQAPKESGFLGEFLEIIALVHFPRPLAEVLNVTGDVQLEASSTRLLFMQLAREKIAQNGSKAAKQYCFDQDYAQLFSVFSDSFAQMRRLNQDMLFRQCLSREYFVFVEGLSSLPQDLGSSDPLISRLAERVSALESQLAVERDKNTAMMCAFESGLRAELATLSHELSGLSSIIGTRTAILSQEIVKRDERLGRHRESIDALIALHRQTKEAIRSLFQRILELRSVPGVQGRSSGDDSGLRNLLAAADAMEAFAQTGVASNGAAPTHLVDEDDGEDGEGSDIDVVNDDQEQDAGPTVARWRDDAADDGNSRRRKKAKTDK